MVIPNMLLALSYLFCSALAALYQYLLLVFFVQHAFGASVPSASYYAV